MSPQARKMVISCGFGRIFSITLLSIVSLSRKFVLYTRPTNLSCSGERKLFRVLLLLTCSLFGSLNTVEATTHIQQASISDVSGTPYTSMGATFSAPTTGGNAIIIGVTYGQRQSNHLRHRHSGESLLSGDQYLRFGTQAGLRYSLRHEHTRRIR